MLLNQPPPTSFDLNFRLFGTRVRIHPAFWVVALFLGWGWARDPAFSSNGVPELLLWVAAMTFSILLHEFGHIWAGHAFGSRGEILLHSMGGLAIGSGGFTRWQSILVSLAGPAIQLALWGVLFYASVPRDQKALGLLLAMLLLINFWWPLLNLLPIWPLDGGQVARQLALIVSPRHGLATSLWISLILAAALAFNALMPNLKMRPVLPWFTGELTALFCALFAVTAYQELAQARPSRRVFDDPW